jgi:hypothetical protein
MSTAIIRGENKLLDTPLLQADGTSPLLLTDCSLIKYELIRNGKVYKTWNKVLTVYDTGMSAATTSTLRCELTKAISDTLPTGTIKRRITIETTDATFTVDGVQRDVSELDLLVVS